MGCATLRPRSSIRDSTTPSSDHETEPVVASLLSGPCLQAADFFGLRAEKVLTCESVFFTLRIGETTTGKINQ